MTGNSREPSPACVDAMTRQLGLWGEEGQTRLKSARVAVGGLGGIGSHAALMLVKAGVGSIRLCDRDDYEVANIVEQAFATWESVGHSKVDTAVREMRRHTRYGEVEGFTGDLGREADCAKLIEGADVVIAAVDNPEGRMALGRAAERAGAPFVVSANIGWSVIHAVYAPERSGYRRMWDDTPGLRRHADGYPDLGDAATRAVVRRQWDMWIAAVSGFSPTAMRELLETGSACYWYAAAPACFAASLCVGDTLKMLTGVGSPSVYPDAFLFDLKRNTPWAWSELGHRLATLQQVWKRGPEAVAVVMAAWDAAAAS